MQLLSHCKLWLYPARTKTDNHTKIISLNNPVFAKNWLIFFLPISFKHSILCDGVYCAKIKYVSSHLLTTKLDTKKSKTKWKKQIVTFVISKLFPNVTGKSCFKSSLQWWVN